MKLSICNKKNNHKPNLQYANQGVILLLLVVRADDQWRKGGCSSFLKFWYAPLTRGGVMVVFSKMQPTVWSFGLCDCHFDLNPPRMAVCVWVFLPVWLLAPSLKCHDCFSAWRILKKVSFPCGVSGSPPLIPLIWQGVLFCKETCLFILIESGLWFIKKVVFEYSWKVFF